MLQNNGKVIAPLIGKLMKEYGNRAYIKTHPKIDSNGKPWVEIEVSASGTDTDELESFVSHILHVYDRNHRLLFSRA